MRAMMDKQPAPRAQPPRIEPEIIPPGGSARWADGFFDARSAHRVYVARLGPVGFFMLALLAALIGALVLLLMVGAFVILVPIAVLLLAGALVGRSLRGSSRRY
jgi:hypothetical protein